MGTAAALAFGLALLMLPLYDSISLWVGVAIGMFVLLLFNVVFLIKYCLPFPQITVLIALIQYILAAWLTYYYPMPYLYSHYNIGPQLPVYLDFAGPLCLALAAGLAVALVGLRRQVEPEAEAATQSQSPQLSRELERLFWVSLGVSVILQFVEIPESLAFVGLLIGNLRYVALAGFTLLSLPGWEVGLSIVLAYELLLALQGGMFHDLALWCMVLVLLLGYVRRWRGKPLL